MTDWTPTDDASLIAGWVADDATTGTGGIASIANLKSGGNALAQATSGNRPDVGTALNGFNSADFVSANSDYMSAAVSFSGSPVMVVAVLQIDADSPSLSIPWQITGTKLGRGLFDSTYDTTGKGLRLVHAGSADTSATVRQLTAGSPAIYVGVINATELRAFLDGEATGAAQSHSSTPNFSGFDLGNRSALDRPFDGKVWFIGVTSDITDATQRKYEGWAAHKFGLTANLPSGHEYKSTAPQLPVEVTAAFGSGAGEFAAALSETIGATASFGSGAGEFAAEVSAGAEAIVVSEPLSGAHGRKRRGRELQAFLDALALAEAREQPKSAEPARTKEARRLARVTRQFEALPAKYQRPVIKSMKAALAEERAGAAEAAKAMADAIAKVKAEERDAADAMRAVEVYEAWIWSRLQQMQ